MPDEWSNHGLLGAVGPEAKSALTSAPGRCRLDLYADTPLLRTEDKSRRSTRGAVDTRGTAWDGADSRDRQSIMLGNSLAPGKS